MISTTLRTSVVLSALALLGNPVASAQSQFAEGVADGALSSIRAAYEAGRHNAVACADGFTARNPGRSWTLDFDSRGVLLQPDASEWSWGLQLESYGFCGREQVVGQRACVSAKAGRVSYIWDDTLEEWFINDARGFEHGYTVRKRPTRDADSNGQLIFNLQVRGELTPNVQTNRRGIEFLQMNGEFALTYSGLTVFDADGTEVPAWFELARTGIQLVVDEAEARYPLTIDPIVQQAYLKASNPGDDDDFGRAVAVSGNTVVVGAYHEESNSTVINGDQSNNLAARAGAAYVFVRSGSTWSQQAYLKASNTDEFDNFGKSVAISGDTIVVGAPLENGGATTVNGDETDNSAFDAGAAYVFVRSGSTWTQQAYLKASNSGSGDNFGERVSISGNTILVTAWLEASGAPGVNGDGTDNSADASGAAYIFVRTGTTWTQQAYLKASNPDQDDVFGISGAISGDTAVVGARSEGSDATGINGDDSNNNATTSGAAYVFARSGSVWSQQAYLKASNAEMFDNFGDSVAISGETVVVGAGRERSNATDVGGNQSNNDLVNAGAAYIFTRSGSVWSQDEYLKATNTESLDGFGNAVAISGNRVVVASVFEDSSSPGINGDQSDNGALTSGAAYVYTRVGSNWFSTAYLKASNAESSDFFGIALDIDGNVVVLGASRESSGASGVNGNETDNSLFASGAAYIIDLDPPQPVGTELCAGDGGDQMGCTDCPCSNNAMPGSGGGCLNSAGTGSRLIATGDTTVGLPMNSTNDLRFSVTDGPPNQLFILNAGNAIAPNNPANACFGLDSGIPAAQFDGLRCAIVNTLRNGGRGSDSNGEVGVTNDPWGGEANPPGGIAQFFGYTAGTTKYFQCIHRDSALVNCMTGLNTTQAIEITFSFAP